jgi:hypothetical protein
MIFGNVRQSTTRGVSANKNSQSTTALAALFSKERGTV